jgi:hypothetical protein
MRKVVLAAALGAASLGLAACGGGDRDGNAAANEAADTANTAGSGEMEGGGAGNASAGATASAFPKGARIVEENGVTYRVDADGTRVRLTDTDSRIVTEGGVRYRVDPDGSRVKIDREGVAIDIDTPDLTPDVDVGINKKGNPDIDVKTNRDGDDGPN